MQELFDFTPKPPEKLAGINMASQLVAMLKSAATNRSGSAKPSDIVDGEVWCKEIADGDREFYVWQEKDGAGDGTLLQDFFKVDAVPEDEEGASEHKFPTEKAMAVFAVKLKKNVVLHRTGDFLVSFNSNIDGFLFCDGSAVSRETYAELFKVIGTKFGDGDGLTTFNLPDFRGRFVQGADGDLGSVKSAGLPNITGSTSDGFIQTWGAYAKSVSGAFSIAQTHTGNTSGNSPAYRFSFDASRSNSVYGASDTVQPPAVALNIFIKY